MNFILQAVSCNGCAVVLLITLLLNYRRKHGAQTEEARLFVRMIISNLMQCLVETVTIIIDGKLFPGAIPLAKVLNAFLFMNNINFSLMWALYAEEKMGVHKKKGKTLWDRVKLVPAVLIVLGSVLNLFTPVFFRITEENVYQRVGIYFLAFFATYFYLGVGIVTIYVNRRLTEKSLFLPAFTFLFPVCLASVVQVAFPGVSLLWSGAAIGLASAYMNLLDESAFTDKLSGLFSRHYLNQYLSTLSERSRYSFSILGIMIDVDDFKSINDQFGHLMGDNAIAAVGKILKSAIPDNRHIFRYAGDEFVIIMPVEHPEDAQSILDRIRTETEHFNKTGSRPYRLSLSMGYTIYVHGENPNAFLDRMDAKMYQEKRLHKAE